MSPTSVTCLSYLFHVNVLLYSHAGAVAEKPLDEFHLNVEESLSFLSDHLVFHFVPPAGQKRHLML